jgi:hypothetical protein
MSSHSCAEDRRGRIPKVRTRTFGRLSGGMVFGIIFGFSALLSSYLILNAAIVTHAETASPDVLVCRHGGAGDEKAAGAFAEHERQKARPCERKARIAQP